MRLAYCIGTLTLALTAVTLRVEAQPTSTQRLVPVDPAASCTALQRIAMPELVALDAEWLAAAPASLVTGPGAGDTDGLPAHCRVRGRIETAIRFELWLPEPGAWSGRFVTLGSESAGGSIPAAALATALRDGFAVAATDTGHTGSGYEWLSDLSQVRDFAYRAVYETAIKSQTLASEFYQRPPDYRYFKGCSLGGQQGLIQAERFPEVFDGILAGSPMPAFTSVQTTRLWATLTAQPLPDQALLGATELELLHSAAVGRCDTLDGVADGVLEDPRRCNVDPARLQCTAGPGGACLSPAQTAAARALYAGPSTRLQSGNAPPVTLPRVAPAPIGAGSDDPLSIVLPTVELPGFTAGSERGWQFLPEAEASVFAIEFFRRLVHADPGWSLWRDFELGRDHALAVEAAGWLFDGAAQNLIRFRNSGGKLLIYHGWNDALSPPEGTVAYVEGLAPGPASGPAARTARDFARLFMVPGMGHCGGGAGTDQFDLLRALTDWVERGIAPDRVEASRVEDDSLVRTRPLCPYPQTARYRGTGATDQTGSFVCSE